MKIDQLIEPTDATTHNVAAQATATPTHTNIASAPLPVELWTMIARSVYDIHAETPIGSEHAFELAPMQSLRLVNRLFCAITDVHATIAELRHTDQALPTSTFEKLLWRFLQEGSRRSPPPADVPAYWNKVPLPTTGEAALGLAALGHAAARTLSDSFVDGGADGGWVVDETAPQYGESHFYKLLSAASVFEPVDAMHALAGPICLYARFDEEQFDWNQSSLWPDLKQAILALPMELPGRPGESPRADMLTFLTGQVRVHTLHSDPRIALAFDLLLDEVQRLPWPATDEAATPQVALLAAAATLIGRSTDVDSFDEVCRLTLRLPVGNPRAKVHEAIAGEVAEMLSHTHEAGPQAFDHCFEEGRTDASGRVLASLLNGFCEFKEFHMCSQSLPHFPERRLQPQHAVQQPEQPHWLKTLLAVEDALDPGRTPESKGRRRLVGALVSCMEAMSGHASSWSRGLQALAISHMARLEPDDQRRSVSAWAEHVAAMSRGAQVECFVQAWQTSLQGSADEQMAMRRLLAREATERCGATILQQIRTRLGIATQDAFLAGAG